MFRIVLALVICLSIPTQAQLITDRPDFTESGVVIPRGHVQVESGATWERVVDTNGLTLPELLVRWTPFDRFEVRLSPPNYVATDLDDGFAPGSIGAKVQIGPLGAWDLGFIAAFAVPVADDVDRSDAFDPEFILTAGRDVSGRVSLGGQAMVSRNGETDVWEYGGTLVAGIGLTDRLGTFVEGLVVDQRGNNVLVLVHHGYTYLVSPTVQLDIHAGLGRFEVGGGQVVIGAGVSALF